MLAFLRILQKVITVDFTVLVWGYQILRGPLESLQGFFLHLFLCRKKHTEIQELIKNIHVFSKPTLSNSFLNANTAFSLSATSSSRYWYLSFFLALHSLALCLLRSEKIYSKTNYETQIIFVQFYFSLIIIVQANDIE